MSKEMNNSRIEVTANGNPILGMAMGAAFAAATVVLFDVHKVLTKKYDLDKPLFRDSIISHATKKMQPEPEADFEDDEDFDPDDFEEVHTEENKAYSEVENLPDQI